MDKKELSSSKTDTDNSEEQEGAILSLNSSVESVPLNYVLDIEVCITGVFFVVIMCYMLFSCIKITFALRRATVRRTK